MSNEPVQGRDDAAASASIADSTSSGRVAAGLLQQLLAPDSALIRRVELHLLLNQLTPAQRASVRAHGRFVLPWPQQHLTLCIHVTRLPTVDAYQMPPKYLRVGAAPAPVSDPDDCLEESGQAWSHLIHGHPASAERLERYLCSFDLRAARFALEGQIEFRSLARSEVGWARLVMEAHRRGALAQLFAASEARQIAQLIGTTLESPRRT
jgi:hypothetical protein